MCKENTHLSYKDIYKCIGRQQSLVANVIYLLFTLFFVDMHTVYILKTTHIVPVITYNN